MYLFYEKENETKARITLKWFVTPPQNILDAGNFIQVSEVNEPDKIAGKAPILYCNPVTKEIFYEYVDRKLTQEEINNQKITELQKAVFEAQNAINSLLEV